MINAAILIMEMIHSPCIVPWWKMCAPLREQSQEIVSEFLFLSLSIFPLWRYAIRDKIGKALSAEWRLVTMAAKMDRQI